MKYLKIMILGVAALGLSAQAQQTAADTVAYCLGRLQGANIRTGMDAQGPEAKTQEYRDAFLAGFKYALFSTQGDAYANGLSIGGSAVLSLNELEEAGLKVDREKMFKAFVDAFDQGQLSEEEQQRLSMSLQAAMAPLAEARKAKADAIIDAAADANGAEGKAYIDSLLASDGGYKKTESGLVYKVIEPGEGQKIADGETAVLKYTGTFTNGEMFDTSGDRTINLSPSQVISGFGEGLKMMGKGSKYILVIPGKLAYGKSAPAQIGPNRTLIFDIEVVDVVKK